jgi:hypothetical protein
MTCDIEIDLGTTQFADALSLSTKVLDSRPCTVVRGDTNNEVLLVSWYWYNLFMNVGATKVYLGAVQFSPN